MTAGFQYTHRPDQADTGPNGVEAEQAILGTLILNNAMFDEVAAIVSATDFVEDLHQRIFKIIGDLVRTGRVARPATIMPYLGGDQKLSDDMLLSAYLARLCSEAMPQALVTGYAKTVRSFAACRKLMDAAGILSARARNANALDDPSIIAAEAISTLQLIAADAGSDTAHSVAHYADALMDLVDGVRSGAILQEPVTTGYQALDRAMNGLEPGALVIGAGRPGMGKSALMNSSAMRTARSGIGVLEFPLEIGEQQLVARHVADIAYRGGGSVAFRDIGRRSRELSDADYEAIRSARAKLREMPIVINDRSRVTVAQIAAEVSKTKRSMAARGVRLGVVHIDHLDFVLASDRYAGNRTQEIGEICLGLKSIARSENVCVVLYAQLNREVEKRPLKERRPGLSDLRNSGDIEQVADVVMFLYRPEYYLTRTPEYLSGDAEATEAAIAAKGKLEVILGKVRAGPTPTIHLWCDMATSSISSFERGTR